VVPKPIIFGGYGKNCWNTALGKTDNIRQKGREKKKTKPSGGREQFYAPEKISPGGDVGRCELGTAWWVLGGTRVPQKRTGILAGQGGTQ